MNDERFSRQVLLAEVGTRGQQRLAEAAVEVPAGPGADVACEYLRRAGVGQVRIADLSPEFPHASFFRHEPSQTVGRGSWQALSALRSLILLDPEV